MMFSSEKDYLWMYGSERVIETKLQPRLFREALDNMYLASLGDSVRCQIYCRLLLLRERKTHPLNQRTIAGIVAQRVECRHDLDITKEGVAGVSRAVEPFEGLIFPAQGGAEDGQGQRYGEALLRLVE